ncbi:MAG TPA: methylated-DNA--[protein]-cysteine S-methyltransferase [bacterium]|nr:methylated-DNA--[protein]-cysteine S-methyltransferase [bacterium]
MDLFVDRMPSPIGALLLVWQSSTLRALSFDDREERLRRWLRLHYGVLRLATERAPEVIRAPIGAYFYGEITAIDRILVHAHGTPFQRQVWAALREIPAGSTTTYGALAVRLGRSGASRAVGLANGSNPVAIVVPCHRVIGANGALTGYGGGIDRKRWLLEHERGGVLGL